VEILNIKEVTKEFDKIVLDRISFSVEEGDIYGIVGQSGSGKTTLLNLIIGFYEPNEGEILYRLDENKKPKKIHHHLSEIRRKFGFSTQISSFYPKLTIKENLWHFGQLYNLPKSVLKNNIKNLLEFTELEKHQDKLAEQLSIGMRRRLDLSCALIHKPKILLLDEPTSNLDPLLQEEILYLIQQANRQGITIIIASHQLAGLEKICNKVALIHQGKIIAHGPLEEIKRQCLQREGSIYFKAEEHHQQLINYIKHLPVNQIINRGDYFILHSSHIQSTLYQLMEITKQKNIILKDIYIKKPSLQEAFEKLIKEKDIENEIQ